MFFTILYKSTLHHNRGKVTEKKQKKQIFLEQNVFQSKKTLLRATFTTDFTPFSERANGVGCNAMKYTIFRIMCTFCSSDVGNASHSCRQSIANNCLRGSDTLPMRLRRNAYAAAENCKKNAVAMSLKTHCNGTECPCYGEMNPRAI